MPSSVAGSTASSTRGPRYKTVAKSSEVDETLFGSTKPTARASKSTMVPGKKKADVVKLSSRELSNIKQRTVILTHEDIAKMEAEKEAEKESRNKESNARKARMLEKEAEAAANRLPTETEVLKQAKDDDTLGKAKYMLDEELDDVKRMNQMMLYSKCVTIRDAQIEEKKVLKGESEDENKRLDLIMEVERLKAMENYEAREQRRAEDRRQGADVLKRQIEEREAERIKEEERRDLERQQILAEMERLRIEEEAQLMSKKEQGRRLLAEVRKANAEQIERKKMMIEAEKEEDARIAIYVKMRERKEQEAHEEAERIRREKELEVMRLRAKQEKASDKQAAMDELRAQRAQEAYERDWRRREKEEAERIQRMNVELATAREKQRKMKMVALAEIAEQERNEYKRIVHAQREKEAEESSAAAQAAAVRRHHKDEILMQIKQNEEARKKERLEFLEEGKQLREQFASELSKLESIKQRKLDELEGAGVPSKYRAELARKKIG